MPVICPRCHKLPLDIQDGSEVVHCTCKPRKSIQAWRFPGYETSKSTPVTAECGDEGDATCINHPDKKSVSVCSSCGCFVCSLCVTGTEAQPLCLGCFTRDQHQQLKVQRKGKRTREHAVAQWDMIALAIALGGFLMWPLMFISGAIAVYLTFRHWKSHDSYTVFPRSRVYFVFAALIGIGQFAGIAMIVIAVATNV